MPWDRTSAACRESTRQTSALPNVVESILHKDDESKYGCLEHRLRRREGGIGDKCLKASEVKIQVKVPEG